MPEKTKKKTARKSTSSKTVRSDRKSVKAEKVSKEKETTSPIENTMETTDHPVKQSSVKVKRSYVVTVLVILILVALIYLVRNVVIAAMVNGQPISRLAVIHELEQQGGKQALDSLVTKTLIQQEAQKRHVTVTQQDVDNEMKTIQANLDKQGQKLDQVLALQGMTKDQLIEQIKLQKMLEKMVGNVSVSDKEIDSYIASNKDSLPQDQDEKTLRANVKNNLQQQKLNQKAQALLDQLRKDAKIDYYIKY